ncbi:MAG TPA: carboxypeptidase regulatory-like domain-containing protein [Candidatus Saccharimonadales bacterium]|nr:carboxypeptidase regulatory-like domain-containing protein [Candidatus Saccharimonadales bacterium]
MNDKTPLATKIIILLLVLVLAALGVVIFQNLNRPRTAISAAESNAPAESYSELPPIRLAQSHVPPTTPSPNRSKPTTPISSARISPTGRALTSAPGAETEVAHSTDQDSNRNAQSILAPVPVISGTASAVEGTGLSGRVLLSGTPPPEKIIDFSGPSEATCGRLHPEPVQTRHYLVGSAGELENVFVYVKEGAPKSTPKSKTPFLDQSGCLYQPYVIGAMTGQRIAFINSDPFMHNVHALPKVPGNQPFNIAQVSKGQTNTKKFEHAEVLVRVQCDVHPWMFAYIGVVDHPYFAVTDKDGKFTIKNLPPGKYIVEAVHPKAGRSSQEITVGDGQNSTLDFMLSVPNTSSVKVATNP